MENPTVRMPKPAEQELFETLSHEQLTLVASWLREEISLNRQYYEAKTSQSVRRLSFVAERIDAIAQRLSSGEPAYLETPASEEAPEGGPERPWRFSEEYWERYEKDD
ncbi:MAG: hypothetical protein AAGM27_00285 [Cyanobacteria bacterium J06554_3]